MVYIAAFIGFASVIYLYYLCMASSSKTGTFYRRKQFYTN